MSTNEAVEVPSEVFLGKLIGTWNTRFECGGMPQPIEGTCRCEWVSQGMSIVQHIDTNMGEMQFRSIRLLAFNPLRQLMEAASLEGAGIGIATGQGRVSPTGTVLHLVSRVDDQQAGGLNLWTETVQTILSEDRHELKIYQLGVDGRQQIGTVTSSRSV